MDLPDELWAAQKAGKLVIFAGAGVSIPAPSDLPSFPKLADIVAAECGRTERLEDPSRIEEFLGRLSEAGGSVHEVVQRTIGKPSSEPNHLHKLIVQLFDAAESLRIVTSNFDMHFETASEDELGNGVNVYRAPALPLGYDFSGIVKLHGSVDDVPGRLVVTDSDFGRAYLTEAWATRFLMDLYRAFTVLFVGYSHDDTVMKYLARGLHGRLQGKRFALTPDEQREKWRALGVAAIPYPPGDDDPHSNLVAALQSWSRISRMGVLQHERQIREATAVPPPSDASTADYISLSLKDEVTCRFFTEHARDVAWLRWVEEKGFLGPLFSSSDEIAPSTALLASWFATRFVCEHPEAALGVVHRAGANLHPFLWQQIIHRLWTRDPRPKHEVVGRWVSLLLRSVPAGGSSYLAYLAQKCAFDEMDDLALILMQYLLSPVVELRPYFGFLSDEESSQEVTPEITFAGDHYALNEAWTNSIKPRIAIYASRLLPLATEALTRTRSLQMAWAPPGRSWDGLSFSRAAIEPHPQDDFPSTVDVTIDIARDTLEYLLRVNPGLGESLIEAWGQSDVPILQRLAVHGIAEASNLSASERLAFVEVTGWLYSHRLKHEVFRLIKENFNEADPVWQGRIVKAAEQGPQGADAESLPDDVRRYVTFNLLAWLRDVAPSSIDAQEAFQRAQEENPTFAPREHPDLDSFHSDFEVVSSPSPLSIEELLRVPPSDPERFNLLLTYVPEEGARGWQDRSGLLGNVSAAARDTFAWGEELASMLSKKKKWDSDLWRSLISAWSDQSLSEAEWVRATAMMSKHKKLGLLAHETASWLEHALTSSPGVPPTQLGSVESLLSKLWSATTQSEEFSDDDSEDWLTTSINAVDGRVVLALIQALSRRRKSSQDWTGLPAFYGDLLKDVVAAAEPHGVAGRTVIASHVHFFFALDEEWTTEQVLPLFDWETSAVRAEQAWHGYLGWGRLSEGLIHALLPYYEKTFDHLGALKRFRTKFLSHLSAIAVVDPANPLSDEWLKKFLAAASDEDRGTFARDIATQLQSLTTEAVASTWEEWLRSYFELRLSSIPVPIGEEESAAMGEWPLTLRAVFDEVVALVIQLSPSGKPYSRVFEEVTQAEDIWVNGETTVQLVVHLLKGFSSPFWQCREAAEAIRKSHEASAPNSLLRDACDELARLGCGEATNLRDLLLP